MKNLFWPFMLFQTTNGSRLGNFPLFSWFADDDDTGGDGDNGEDDGATKSSKKSSGKQTDFEQMYVELTSKIQAGDYVTKAAYTSLQRKLQEKTNALDEANGKLGDTQTTIDGLNATITELTGSKETLTTDLATANQAKTAAEAKFTRLSTIAGQYPQLLQFELQENGVSLLPQVEDLEQLPGALENFSKALGSIKDAEATKDLSGSTKVPEGKDSKGARTSANAKQEMNAAMGKGDINEYEKLREEYFKLLEQEEGKS